MAEKKLYGDRVKEMAQKAKKGCPLDDFDNSEYVKNPMCGDDVTVYIKDVGEGRYEVGYKARGCLICLASCARMEEIIENGMSKTKIKKLVEKVEAIFDNGVPEEMELFAPVEKHRSRHECVKLPFRALSKLIDGT